MAVGGDSAGGNLAAVVAQLLRDNGPPLRFQLLVYPVTEMHLSHPSIDENADGYFLTKADMTWFRDHYCAGDDWSDPRMSPLHAADEPCAGVAPALVITAEYDPLRDEGEAYAAKLAGRGRRRQGQPLRRRDPRVLLDGRPGPRGQGRHRRGRRGAAGGAG